MPSTFKRNIQNPSSPDKDIKAAGAARYKQSAFARLSDINAATRSDNDQILYTLNLGSGATGSTPITTKKGVVKITTTGSGATLTITLTNSELLVAETDQYFVQATVAHPSLNIYVGAVPIATNGNISFKINQVGGPGAWNGGAGYSTFLNYSIYKIGD